MTYVHRSRGVLTPSWLSTVRGFLFVRSAVAESKALTCIVSFS